MKVLLLSGQTVEAKIKKAPAWLLREYGFTKLAHWSDDTGPCSVPVVKSGKQYIEIVSAKEK